MRWSLPFHFHPFHILPVRFSLPVTLLFFSLLFLLLRGRVDSCKCCISPSRFLSPLCFLLLPLFISFSISFSWVTIFLFSFCSFLSFFHLNFHLLSSFPLLIPPPSFLFFPCYTPTLPSLPILLLLLVSPSAPLSKSLPHSVSSLEAWGEKLVMEGLTNWMVRMLISHLVSGVFRVGQ